APPDSHALSLHDALPISRSLSPDDEEKPGSVGSCLHATGRSSSPAIHARVQRRSENMGQIPSATWFEATRRLWHDDVFQKGMKRHRKSTRLNASHLGKSY